MERFIQFSLEKWFVLHSENLFGVKLEGYWIVVVSAPYWNILLIYMLTQVACFVSMKKEQKKRKSYTIVAFPISTMLLLRMEYIVSHNAEILSFAHTVML